VKPADGGLEVTSIPKGISKEVEDKPRTMRYVHVNAARPDGASNGVFIGVEKDEGVYPLIALLHDGQYLYNLRAVPRT
jgi:hypothetical protein